MRDPKVSLLLLGVAGAAAFAWYLKQTAAARAAAIANGQALGGEQIDAPPPSVPDPTAGDGVTPWMATPSAVGTEFVFDNTVQSASSPRAPYDTQYPTAAEDDSWRIYDQMTYQTLNGAPFV